MLDPRAPAPHASRRLLRDDHVALIRRFDDVLALLGQNDHARTHRAWVTFASALTGHLDAEEALVLPVFQLISPAEAQALLDDHAKFRETLDELGIAAELQTLRADTGRALIAALRAHSEREDRTLYRWAEEHLGADSLRRLREPLRTDGDAAGAW
jgi:hypothetical protein